MLPSRGWRGRAFCAEEGAYAEACSHENAGLSGVEIACMVGREGATDKPRAKLWGTLYAALNRLYFFLWAARGL